MTGGIFPDRGFGLHPLHWLADSYPLYHQRSPEVAVSPHLSIQVAIQTPTAPSRVSRIEPHVRTRTHTHSHKHYTDLVSVLSLGLM